MKDLIIDRKNLREESGRYIYDNPILFDGNVIVNAEKPVTFNSGIECSGDFSAMCNIYVRGYLLCDGQLTCKGLTHVDQTINAYRGININDSFFSGGSVITDGDLKVNGSIIVGLNIEVKKDMKVTDNVGVGGNFYVDGSINIGDYLKVKEKIRYGSIKRIDGLETKKFISLSMFYCVAIYDEHIRIDRILRRKDVWKKMSNQEIEDYLGLDGLKFWNDNKNMFFKI